MLRRLGSAAVLASFVAFIGLVTIWVRSYWVAESNWWQQKTVAGAGSADPNSAKRVMVGLGSDSGKLTVGLIVQIFDKSDIMPTTRWGYTYTRVPDDQFTALPYIWDDRDHIWGFYGFYIVNRGDDYSDEVFVMLVIPYWALTLLSAVAPAVWLVRFFRSRRRLAGGFPVELISAAASQ